MPAEAPIRHALGKPVFQSETEGLREGGLSRKKPPAFGHQKRPRFRVFGVAAFLGMSLRQYSLARQEPENGEIPREEQRKEENEVPAFSIGSRSKPVDESLYPGKKETGRYDSDNAGIEKFHALHSLEWGNVLLYEYAESREPVQSGQPLRLLEQQFPAGVRPACSGPEGRGKR